MTVIDALSPADAIRYCRDLTRRRARNFYYGLKLLPEPQRSGLFAVYAWMRRVDDIVDDRRADPAAARQEIEAFGRATEAALGGDVAEPDPVLVGIRETAARFPLRAAHFRDMLEGQLDDVDGVRYETFDDLSAYCARVASSVGLVCIGIWGYDDDAAAALAADRGIAFQLTNILRDLAEDHASGRVYLPAADFARHEVTLEQVLRWDPPDRCRRFLMEQVERAESFYERSAGLDAMISPACRPALWAMTSIYHGLLQRIRLHPSQVVRGPRVRLNSLNKGTIALRARLMARR